MSRVRNNMINSARSATDNEAPAHAGVLGLIITTLLAGAGLFVQSAGAVGTNNCTDNGDGTVSCTNSATASVTVASACTMTSSLDSAHTATVSPNQYKDEIGQTTFKVVCNDAGGFSIYAVGYTGNKIGDTNSTKLVGKTTSGTIATGTAKSGDISNWAMKITPSGSSFTPIADNGFNNYSAVPSEYTKVAHFTGPTDSGDQATGSTITTTYASFVSGSEAPDTYEGKVKYTLVNPASSTPAQPVPCVADKICYNTNATNVEGQMGKQTSSNNAEATLYAPNFKRVGYGFAGWNTEYDYSGETYGPNQTITAPSDLSTKGLPLYAMWVKSEGTLQNWDGCSSMSTGEVTALTDNRDNDTYAVAKLADNKCWMIENLRLDDGVDLSSSNTHNPSLPLTNSWWYGSDNDSDTKPTSNHLSATANPTTTAWCNTKSSNCDDQSMLATNNTTLFTNNTSSSYSAESNVYSYGNYYNWYSATAGHGKYGSSYSQGYEAPGDICPAGWHLPKGGNKSQESTNELWQLVVIGLNEGTNPANYDSFIYPYYTGTEATPVSNALRSYPNNFVYSGGVNNLSVYYRNYDGRYWSSSASSGENAYFLAFTSKSVYPGSFNDYGSGKYSGRVVRCIADV